MMGKEWCKNPENVRTLNKLGPKLINLHSRKICSSEDLLFVIKHPIQTWSSENGFCKLLLQHFVIEERLDKTIALIKFEAGNLLKPGDFVKEALEELKSDHEEIVQQIENMIAPSGVDDASAQVVLGGDHEEGGSN